MVLTTHLLRPWHVFRGAASVRSMNPVLAGSKREPVGQAVKLRAHGLHTFLRATRHSRTRSSHCAGFALPSIFLRLTTWPRIRNTLHHPPRHRLILRAEPAIAIDHLDLLDRQAVLLRPVARSRQNVQHVRTGPRDRREERSPGLRVPRLVRAIGPKRRPGGLGHFPLRQPKPHPFGCEPLRHMLV